MASYSGLSFFGLSWACSREFPFQCFIPVPIQDRYSERYVCDMSAPTYYMGMYTFRSFSPILFRTDFRTCSPKCSALLPQSLYPGEAICILLVKSFHVGGSSLFSGFIRQGFKMSFPRLDIQRNDSTFASTILSRRV